MKTIFKYLLDDDFGGPFTVSMPAGARFLRAGEQGNSIVVWAQVNTNFNTIEYEFYILGTGWEIDTPDFERFSFIDTVQMKSGLVWHVFVKSPYLWDGSQQ